MINMITNKNYKNQYVYLVEGRVFTNKEQAINYAKENDKEKVVERLALNVDGDCLTESKDKIVWKSTSNIKRLNESLNENDVDVITEEYDFDDDEIADDDDYIHTNYDNEIEIEVTESRGIEDLDDAEPEVKWAVIKPYLNVKLEDDDTPTGGISYEGETFVDFIDELGWTDLEIAEMTEEEWNELLKDCGIKPIFPKKEESLKESKTDNTDKKELVLPPFQIKVWETKEDRDQGEPYICNYFDRNSIEKAIKTADRLFKDSESVEVYNKNGDIVYGLYNEEETDESLKEDTVKTKDGKWTNKGKEGTHGKFKTKKQADAQRKAMFANGYKENLIKESKNNEWENYGDVNFLTYGGTLLKEVAPQEYEIIRLFTPWSGTKEGEYILGTCHLNTQDYEDSMDDISNFTGADYSGLDKDKWFAVDLVDYYGTYQLGGTDEVLTKDEVIEVLKDKGVDIDTLGSFEESLKEGIDYNYQLRDGYEALDKANINFNVEEDTFDFNDSEDTQKAFDVLSKVYGRDNVNVISAFKLKVDIEGFSGNEGRYVEEDYKQVYDSDGFLTDYTMYFDTLENRYVFVFGDNDIYKPEDGDFDWECESEEEAREWFDNYKGFEEEDEIDESLNPEVLKKNVQELKQKLESWKVDTSHFFQISSNTTYKDKDGSLKDKKNIKPEYRKQFDNTIKSSLFTSSKKQKCRGYFEGTGENSWIFWGISTEDAKKLGLGLLQDEIIEVTIDGDSLNAIRYGHGREHDYKEYDKLNDTDEVTISHDSADFGKYKDLGCTEIGKDFLYSFNLYGYDDRFNPEEQQPIEHTDEEDSKRGEEE